eukprot:6915520-Alexandrium_andersonii.AAC.1
MCIRDSPSAAWRIKGAPRWSSDQLTEWLTGLKWTSITIRSPPQGKGTGWLVLAKPHTHGDTVRVSAE